MAGQRYLRNQKTGVLHYYSKEGAKHPDMVECNKPSELSPAKVAAKAAASAANGDKPVSQMSLDALVEHASGMGITVPEGSTKKEIRAMIAAGPPEVDAAAPFADLSDEQLVDFGADLDVILDPAIGRDMMIKLIVDREEEIKNSEND